MMKRMMYRSLNVLTMEVRELRKKMK